MPQKATDAGNRARARLKTLAKVCAVLGGLLLLGSYIAQNYVYDKWDARTRQLAEAISDQSLLEKSVPLNELLYLSWHNDGSLSPVQDASARQFKLREAVRKTIYAQSIPIKLSAAPEQVEPLKARLNAAGARVFDLASYTKFIAEVNEVTKQYEPPGLEIHRTRAARDLWRCRFLVTYVVGSVILLLGAALKPD